MFWTSTKIHTLEMQVGIQKKNSSKVLIITYKKYFYNSLVFNSVLCFFFTSKVSFVAIDFF